jgi:peptidoglycan/xylan/chitin deacetylase (PgdA/CDA1 family)
LSVRSAVRATAIAASVLGTAAYLSAFQPRSQVFGDFPWRGSTTEKVVALTFDDGPNEPYTSRLLDVLDEREVRATFFQVGRCALRFPSATRRVVASGHVLGNHSYSHAFTRYVREPDQQREVRRAQEVLTDIAGVAPALYRPPWLCHWPWVLQTVREQHLQVVSGTFGHPLEVFQPPAPMMTAGAAAAVRPGSIMIFHDGREARGGPRDQSVAAIGPLIDRLRDDGYRFTTVDQLLGVPAYAA